MSETGIIPNIEKFKILYTACESYGARYNPSNPNLLLTAQQTIITNAEAAVDKVTSMSNPRNAVINSRQELFALLPPYAKRIVASLSVCQGITETTVNDAKHWLRKIRGERVSKKILNPAPEDPVQISASQRSFQNQAEFYSHLISWVLSHAEYIPNETELKAPALNDFKTQLNNANDAAIAANEPWLSAIIARDVILYAPLTGLVDIAFDVKKYVRSVKDISYDEYKLISNLRFTRPKKK